MTKRTRLPDERPSLTHKVNIAGSDLYITVGLYDDGAPGEVFIRFAKTGGREGALLDAWATMVSIAIQSGVPLGVIVEKFRGWRFEPQGCTTNSEIPMASSPLDYIARWLELRFLKGGDDG